MKDHPKDTIEKQIYTKKTWLKATTLNMLPGEEIYVDISEENGVDLKPNEKTLKIAATVNEDGTAFALFNSRTEALQHVTMTNIENASYFKKGWWSIDAEGEKPITRAVPGMHVYFHVETTIPDGEQVHIELYEDDNDEGETCRADEDDHQPLVSSATKKPSTHETVNNGKILKSILLDNLERLIEDDTDEQIELYFRCSYNNENVELPSNTSNYLVVGKLIIDRYKIPGLNGGGTDIADDLTYGFGIKKGGSIYTTQQLNTYKNEYETSGFSEEKHGLFTNKVDPSPVVPAIVPPKEEAKDLATTENDKKPLIIDKKTIKIDNTYVATPSPKNIYKQAEFAAQEATKNQKSKYSREEMYAAKYKFISTGLDIRIFDNFSDEKLFWNFKNTAQLYFARGELQGNLDRMIAKFKSNTGGIHEDPILTKHIKVHPSTLRYCTYIENYIAEKIKEVTLSDVLGIEDKEPTYELKEDKDKRRRQGKIKGNDIKDNKGKAVPISRPTYSYDSIWDATKGLTIALNDIWATEVILKELKNNGETYTCKYQVTLWDHFGLDLPDMEKIFNIIPSIGETFVCWFILQHLRGYKPFATKITFEQSFKGNINEGREERRANQKGIEEKLKKAEQVAKNKRALDKARSPWPIGPK